MNDQLTIHHDTLTLEAVLAQRELVLSLMKAAMTEGVHYGKVPGCGDKPCLFQPGAQMMAVTFRLAPTYRLIRGEPSATHREYEVVCSLMRGEAMIAEGVGCCSSMESKYRYRNAAPIVEDTGEAVPKSYWDNPDKGSAKADLSRIFGGNCTVKKVDGEWHVMRITGGGDGKVENPNPADVFNTVLKLAKKRAYVDAVISATACNDLFTQDLEDIRENLATMEAHSETKVDLSHPANEPPKTWVKSDPLQTPDATGQEHIGLTITNIVKKEGIGDSGRPWKAWAVTFDGLGTAGTFSETIAREAARMFDAKIPAKAVIKPSKFAGKFDLVSISEMPDEVP